jgi:hypothetical protein
MVVYEKKRKKQVGANDYLLLLAFSFNLTLSYILFFITSSISSAIFGFSFKKTFAFSLP